jgi:hypothetical protein
MGRPSILLATGKPPSLFERFGSLRAGALNLSPRKVAQPVKAMQFNAGNPKNGLSPTTQGATSMADQEIEQEIQAKGLTAPRVTPADVEANIKQEYYFTAAEGYLSVNSQIGKLAQVYPSALGLLTFCVIELQNGFTVTGEAACVSPENFDAEIGRKIARQNAVAKIWPLMGYALRSRLAA